MAENDPKNLHPGDVIECVSGDHHDRRVVLSRKDDGSGWWLLDGSGLADVSFDRCWSALGVRVSLGLTPPMQSRWPGSEALFAAAAPPPPEDPR